MASSNFDDPNHRLVYSYDSLGHVVRIEDPDLDGTGYTSTTYSNAGNLSSTTNARGQVRSYSYDALDRLIGIEAPPGEDGYTVEYQPAIWQRWKDSSPAYERVRTYDGWGRVTQTQLSVMEDGWTLGWNGIYFMDFSYDLAGRPIQVDLLPKFGPLRMRIRVLARPTRLRLRARVQQALELFPG